MSWIVDSNILAHGVTHILTLNPRDFARYANVTAVTPQEVLQGITP